MSTLRMNGWAAGILLALSGCVAPGTATDRTAASDKPAEATGAPAEATGTPAAAPASSPPQQQAVRALARPANAVGDVCYYDRTIGYKKMRETRTLTSMTDDKFVWDIQTDTGIRGVLEAQVVDSGFLVTRDVSWANGQNVTIAPGYKWISFPAEPGQAWDVKTDFKGQTFSGMVEDEIKIDKWEKVKVPAGEFNALRMNFKSAYWNAPRKGDRPDVKGHMTLWTSPETKCLLVELKFSNSVGERGTTRLVGSN